MRSWCIRSLFWGRRIISFLGWSRIKMISVNSSSTRLTTFSGKSRRSRRCTLKGKTQKIRTAISTCLSQSSTTPRHGQFHQIPAEFHSSRWPGRNWCFLWARALTDDTSSHLQGTTRLMLTQKTPCRRWVWTSPLRMCSGSRRSSRLRCRDDLCSFLMSLKLCE